MAGLRDGRTIMAWQIAQFTRAKKLPKVETLLSKKKERSMADLKNMLKGFQSCRK